MSYDDITVVLNTATTDRRDTVKRAKIQFYIRYQLVPIINRPPVSEKWMQ